jgi:YidC/Oxa1 family membrane protein insertase
MDIKRLILWFVFSVSLVFLWAGWQRSAPVPAPITASVPTSTVALSERKDIPTATTASPTMPAALASDAPIQKYEVVTVTTDVVKAQFSTVGGELVYLELLKQKDIVHKDKNMILFDVRDRYTYVAQTGLIGGSFPTHKSLFTVEQGARDLGTANEIKLVMRATEGNVTLTKTFTLHRGSYLVDIKHEVLNQSAAAINPILYLQLVRDGNKPEGESMLYSTFTGPAVFTDAEKFQKIDFEHIEKNNQDHAKKANNGWVALIQHYFVSAFIPLNKTEREIFTRKVGTNLYAVGTLLPLGQVASQHTVSMESKLYAGPQESHILEQVAPGLDLVKDYGWLTVISKPIFWLMEQIHKVLNNWGWTIIVLTVLIKLLFFPLSAASYRSMAKMKLVTPKMISIRERYKSEPQKMNQAMMELYRTEKINPLGGCLPILVQIPVFIALYWVLLASVEVRNAPWLGWITDLASPDPYYILPLVMAASMYIQTKLNPMPADPIQAKVMMWMPIVFSIMFFFFPSGLVLYWVVNNILSIAQQWVITKRMNA